MLICPLRTCTLGGRFAVIILRDFYLLLISNFSSAATTLDRSYNRVLRSTRTNGICPISRNLVIFRGVIGNAA
jgi:hypothetical protein